MKSAREECSPISNIECRTPLEVFDIMCARITQALEMRDKRIAALRGALLYLIKGEPENDGTAQTACTFCDMGGAGYSSRGDRHHDDVRDVCPVHVAELALEADDKATYPTGDKELDKFIAAAQVTPLKNESET